MFEDYLKDSKYFYEQASSEEGDEDLSRRYFRAAVFCAASAMEAFINFIGSTIETAGTLEPNEIAYINDQVLEISPSKGLVESKMKFNPIDGKIKFIIKRLNVDVSFESDVNWNHFKDFKKLRDRLVHPKDTEDEISVTEYQSKLKYGLNANIYLINKIAAKVFTKGLRKSLLDLTID
ncbi:MAG: hypothetical protein KDC79_15495 [Cyclobacteriaceae bacterium]|nr:hypothetical protein [Cyclobacteriaceae bacterium]